MNLLLRSLLVFILIAGSDRSTAQWTRTSGPTGGAVQSLAASGTNLFAGTYGGGVFFTSNYGDTWIQVNTGLINTQVNALATKGGRVFAGTFGGIYASDNNGTTWTTTGLMNTIIRSLAIHDSLMFAGTWKGAFLSTDNGATWTEKNAGLTNTDVHAIASDGTRVFAGTPDGIFYSGDTGKTWTAANNGLTNKTINSLVIIGTNILAGTAGGAFRSIDNGMTWISITKSMPSVFVWTLLPAGTNLFAGGSGLYLGMNGGTSWLSPGLPDSTIISLAIGGQYLFAGTGTCVCRRVVSEMITDVGTDRDASPHGYALEQNYPNPFNPSTRISFSLPTPSVVTLTVADVMGRETPLLHSKEYAAGRHAFVWNAEGMPGGVYFYRMHAQGTSNGRTELFLSTKKLILLR